MSENAKALLLQALDDAGITDANERAMFMAQMHHESAGFTRMRESFAYKPERLMAISATARRKGLAAVKAALASGREATAELMYGGRADLGNTHAGDGAKFFGRGYTQLTGRANYEAASKALGIDLVNHPELAETPEVAAKIAVWFWQGKHCSAQAQRGDTKGVTQKINGGDIGLADREKLFAQYSHDSSTTGFA